MCVEGFSNFKYHQVAVLPMGAGTYNVAFVVREAFYGTVKITVDMSRDKYF